MQVSGMQIKPLTWSKQTRPAFHDSDHTPQKDAKMEQQSEVKLILWIIKQ
jgi:hypothetical protein